jgi:UDP-GlcNAc3NAcA epimerase
MKILTVVGARPQFIKAAPVSLELRKFHKEILVHTGQHYDKNMSDIFFHDLGIPNPDYNLEVGSQSHAQQTANIMTKLEDIIIKEKPDCVLLYGDTNSTLAGAITASKLNIKIIHIEAGLRSFDMAMPEEVNRIITDKLSSLLFVPTDAGIENLTNEGIKEGVYLVGDVMLDAVLKYIKTAEQKSKVLEENNLKKNEYILLTMHRPSITDDMDRMKNVLEIIEKSGKKCIFPIHPRTRSYLQSHLNDEMKQSIKIIDPVGYIDSLWLMKNAEMLITDSGGMQKESYMLQTPCITIRENTEWVETLDTGWNYLAGYDIDKLKGAIDNFKPKGKQSAIFGDGKASEKIVEIINGLGI